MTETPPVLPSPIPGTKLVAKPPKRIKLPPGSKAATGRESPFPTPSFGKIRIPSHIDRTPLPRAESPVVPPPIPPKDTVLKKEVAFAAPVPKVKLKAPPPKKAKSAIHAQASGMSINDYKACKSALKKLQTSKHSILFAVPVDPVRDNAPK